MKRTCPEIPEYDVFRLEVPAHQTGCNVFDVHRWWCDVGSIMPDVELRKAPLEAHVP